MTEVRRESIIHCTVADLLLQQQRQLNHRQNWDKHPDSVAWNDVGNAGASHQPLTAYLPVQMVQLHKIHNCSTWKGIVNIGSYGVVQICAVFLSFVFILATVTFMNGICPFHFWIRFNDDFLSCDRLLILKYISNICRNGWMPHNDWKTYKVCLIF